MKGRGGAAVSDVFRYEEVPPSHQPSGGGHEAGSPLGRRPWSARRGHGLPRASATWLAPGCRPHRGAAPQLRFVVGRYAATAARYAARRLVPRSGTTSWPRRGLGAAATQVWRTRPKPFYETQLHFVCRGLSPFRVSVPYLLSLRGESPRREQPLPGSRALVKQQVCAPSRCRRPTSRRRSRRCTAARTRRGAMRRTSG